MSEVISKTIEQKVEEALKQIRPYLEADGGDISLFEVTPDFIARVRFHGACKSCNMSFMTLKSGIEETVKRAVPEIISVEQIDISSPYFLP